MNSLSPDRKRQLLALLVTASCLTGCREAPEEPQVALRLQYQVGDTLYYEYTANGTATYPDTVTADKTTKTYERNLRVDEVATDLTPSGNYLLAWTYHLPARVEDGVEAEPGDFTINLEISPQGRIIDVTNLETAKTLFHDMDFRTYLEQTQPVFPERALKIGDSWTQQVKVLSPEAEPVVTTSNYVLEDLTEATSICPLPRRRATVPAPSRPKSGFACEAGCTSLTNGARQSEWKPTPRRRSRGLRLKRVWLRVDRSRSSSRVACV
jgi:hypothetical protein